MAKNDKLSDSDISDPIPKKTIDDNTNAALAAGAENGLTSAGQISDSKPATVESLSLDLQVLTGRFERLVSENYRTHNY